MPQVTNIYSLIVLLAFLAAGIVLLVLGYAPIGSAMLGLVIGGAAVPRPVTKPTV